MCLFPIYCPVDLPLLLNEQTNCLRSIMNWYCYLESNYNLLIVHSTHQNRSTTTFSSHPLNTFAIVYLFGKKIYRLKTKQKGENTSKKIETNKNVSRKSQ